jgi:glycopeptide antibiotics resistance protein
MSTRKVFSVFVGKLMLAAVAILAIVGLAASELAPALPFGQLLLYCAAGLAALFALLVVAAVCSLQFSQFILRIGGTDAQWFWFSSETKGLMSLRQKHVAQKENQ